MAGLPSGDRRRPLRDRRDGQDRRPLLLLPAVQADARHPARAGCPWSASTSATPTWCRSTTSPRRWTTSPTSPDLDGQAFHLVNPEPHQHGRPDQHLRLGRQGAAVRRTRRPHRDQPAADRLCSPQSLRPANLVGAALRLAPVHLALEPDHRPARRPARGARSTSRSRRSTPPAPPRRRWPARASRCPTSTPTPRPCGRYWEEMLDDSIKGDARAW